MNKRTKCTKRNAVFTVYFNLKMEIAYCNIGDGSELLEVFIDLANVVKTMRNFPNFKCCTVWIIVWFFNTT